MSIRNQRLLVHSLLVSCLILFFVEANAWEADVHYGLIKWLSVQVGFSASESETIAQGSYAIDQSSALSATALVPSFACFWSVLNPDSAAGELVRDLHFPSDGVYPGDPTQRAVLPGSSNIQNYPIRQIEDWLKGSNSNLLDNNSLREFGKYLHSLADSWSHQGFSGTPPFICNPDYVWAHPKNRGGWWSHNADLTYLHIQETVDVAEILAKYLHEYHSKATSSVNWDWTKFEKDVREFAEASTIDKKYEWFKKQNNITPLSSYKYVCFLDSISLSRKGTQDCVGAKLEQRKARRLDRQNRNQSVEDFIDNFLNNWIVQKDFSAALLMMDVTNIAEGLSPQLQINHYEWLYMLLSIWFIKDHGLVNSLGHGMLEDIEGYSKLSDIPRELKFSNLSEAILSPELNDTYKLLVEEEESGEISSATVSFYFLHAPKDTILFTVTKANAGWVINEFQWVVTE